MTPSPLLATTHEVFNQVPPLVGTQSVCVGQRTARSGDARGRGRCGGLAPRARRRARHGRHAGTGRGGGPVRPGAACVRRERPPPRRGRIPSGLSRADGVSQAPRCRCRTLGGPRAGRARAARRLLPHVRAARGRHAVPDDDDLRERARIAPRAGTGERMAAAYLLGGIRPALPAGGRQAWRDDRHGHDGEAGRLRRARQHHGRAARRRPPLPDRRPQVVLLRADVRRVPRPGAGGRRPVVLPAAALRAGRERQRHPHPAAQGQAGRSLQRELGGRVLERARRTRRRGGARRGDHPRDGHLLPSRLRARHRRADPGCGGAGAASRAAPRGVRPAARGAAADAQRAGRPRARIRSGDGAGDAPRPRLRRAGRCATKRCCDAC